MLGSRLNTLHNVHYYQELMSGLRQAIEAGRVREHADKARSERLWLGSQML